MKIKQLTLFSDKIQNQRTFYESVLGFTVADETENKFSIKSGWTELTFVESKTPYIYHFCFLIPIGKLATAIDWLKDKTELIPGSNGQKIHHHNDWNAEAIYFYDKGGNIVEFIVHNNLSYEEHGPFKISDIVAINEIGMPSCDSRSMNNHINNILGTTMWKGDKDRFVSNGNEEGMFLLVNNEVKHSWYPTTIFPQSSPFQADVEVNNKLYSINFDGEKFTILQSLNI